MKKLSRLDAEQAKTFSKNHRTQSVVLKSYSAETEVLFEAKLTLGEFEAVCDFITANFKNDGRK